jgi:hypothetical protein
MLRPWRIYFYLTYGGKCEQGFRRMAARNKPAGIRSLVYGVGKGKVGIEGFERVLSPGDGGVKVSPEGLEPSTH